MSESPRLRSTRNYAEFYPNPANRPVSPKHLKKLRPSMLLYGWIPAFPMLVKETASGRMILDGEHRYTIAQELGLVVWYVATATDYDVPTINAGGLHWMPSDYAVSYAEQGVQAYRDAIEFAKAHALSIGDAAAMLAGTICFSNLKSEWFAGAYKITALDYANAVVRLYDAIRNIKREVADKSLRHAIMAVCRVPGFDSDRLLRKARQYPDALQKFATKDAALTMLETIYNHGRGEKVALRIEALAAMTRRNPARRNPANR
jgi:hypothetical protein